MRFLIQNNAVNGRISLVRKSERVVLEFDGPYLKADFGPKDFINVNNWVHAACAFVYLWAEDKDDEVKTLAREFLAQWEEGPQL